MNFDNSKVPHSGGLMNGATTSSSCSNDILQLLLQQQYQLTQQQQQFRWHQQQYLGSHTNRRPNHDELFEMAGMLLSEPPGTTNTRSNNNDSRPLESSMTAIHTITPSNSIRGDEIDTTTPRATRTALMGMNKKGKSSGGSDTLEGEDGLFDEDELEEVLGEVKNEETLEKKVPNPAPPNTPAPSPTGMYGPTNFLPEKTLDELLHPNPRKRSSLEDEDGSPLSGPHNMNGNDSEEAEWYLIDFGDDNEHVDPDLFSESERPIKRSRSFETNYSGEY